MKKSIFLKIVCGYFLIIVLLSLTIFFFSFRTIRHYHLQTLVSDLTKIGKTLFPVIEPSLSKDKNRELDRLTKRLGEEINTRITIIDFDGIVLADSEKDPLKMENHKLRSEVIQALLGNVASSLRYSTTINEPMLYVALPFYRNNEVKTVVRVSLFVSDINLILNDLKKSFIQITFIFAFIALLIAYIVARRLTGPIRKLSAASTSVASGNFETRVFLKNNDEFKELGDCFNVMTEKIRSLFDEVSIQKEELYNIISSMNEGLLLIDKENRICVANESLKKITRMENVEKKLYWEVIREQKLGDMIEKARHEKNTSLQEILYKEKTFLCSFSFIKATDEILITFLEISELKNIERMKKDFVINVSHELRTPLTAIKGFVETMKDGNTNSNYVHYLEIIQRHTDRLINIVKDLTTLSAIEEGQVAEIQSTNMLELAEQVISIFKEKLSDNNISFDLSFEGKPYPLMVDPFKIEQIFINLIDNAIKYTEKGTINIRLLYLEGSLEILFQDSGIGIDKEHLTKIFERFYVVDKSRSRRVGGTGLGLSIVKHIVLLHKGTIDVDSTLGKGTCFKITLPAS